MIIIFQDFSSKQIQKDKKRTSCIPHFFLLSPFSAIFLKNFILLKLSCLLFKNFDLKRFYALF